MVIVLGMISEAAKAKPFCEDYRKRMPGKPCNCLVQRDEAQRKRLIGNFIPQCENNGNYKKIQCNGSTGFCYCAKPTTGEQLTVPKRGLTNC
ncbi:hypothetical protein NPIL_690071 [Nephila pilipes]|uniref:Thyroglobulin type-1 domain-containing protein n=1 Tax=Nephila pilipes TaxID=299642 RepID=A0A8X6P707_NEPPI|nr:hypothetical protein NPIL_690071 [Nephila pilipes]